MVTHWSDPLTHDEKEIEAAQWHDSLRSRLRAAEERFCTKNGRAGAALEVLDEPSPLAPALAALKKSKRASGA